MKHIFEEYGDMISEILGTTVFFGILAYLIHSNGFLADYISRYLLNGC